MREKPYTHWRSLADIPKPIRDSGLRGAMSLPEHGEALAAAATAAENTLLRLLRREQARLAVAAIRADHPLVSLVVAEHAVALITCMSPLTVRNVCAKSKRKGLGEGEA